MVAAPLHEDIAGRFRFFLAEIGLNRRELSAALDDAIDPRSLFSILNGHRRPSRGLAVLIERTWGFRAKHLLEGEGEPWTTPAFSSGVVGGAALSPGEAEVVDFMRASGRHAEAVLESVETLRLDLRAQQHLDALRRALNATADLAGEPPGHNHSLLCRIFVEDFSTLRTCLHGLREATTDFRLREQLVDFVERFLLEAPRDRFGETADELSEIANQLGTSIDRAEAAAHETADRARTTCNAVLAMGSEPDRARSFDPEAAEDQQSALLQRLLEGAPEELREEAREVFGKSKRDDRERDEIQRLIESARELRRTVESKPGRPLTPAALDARYRSVVAANAA